MRLERLAPIAFVAGVVLFGLSVLALTFTATAPGHGPVEEYEVAVVDDEVVQAYPVPISPQVATRIDVTFDFPQHSGKVMIVGCGGYSALLQGQEPRDVRASTTGGSGSLSSATGPDASPDQDGPSLQCPFRYVVFQWPLLDGAPLDNQPEATVETSAVLTTSLVLISAGGVAVIGIGLALLGGTSWARQLQRVRATEAADENESTSETLLLLIGKTGDWLVRMRRYLVAAGILGIFLWYPIVLPWAWGNVLDDSTGGLYGWLVTLGALALLVTLTIVWARAYLRLDRELVAWRERVDRLRERESRLLDDLDAAG